LNRSVVRIGDGRGRRDRDRSVARVYARSFAFIERFEDVGARRPIIVAENDFSASVGDLTQSVKCRQNFRCVLPSIEIWIDVCHRFVGCTDSIFLRVLRFQKGHAFVISPSGIGQTV
jgi:hypothetical protein